MSVGDSLLNYFSLLLKILFDTVSFLKTYEGLLIIKRMIKIMNLLIKDINECLA